MRVIQFFYFKEKSGGKSCCYDYEVSISSKKLKEWQKIEEAYEEMQYEISKLIGYNND